MELFEFSALPVNFLTASSITIGNFDGVHLGHREIIGEAVKRSRRLDIPSVLVTFEPHPREVIFKGKKIPAIIPFSERANLIAEIGVDFLVKVNFTEEFSNLTADEFLLDVQQKLHPKVIVIGHDFRFGKGREGDEEFLLEAGQSRGFLVHSVPAYNMKNEPISSTRIRGLIEEGDVHVARKLLGAPFHVEGDVIRGHGRGRELGFATANLNWEAELIPPDGVYVVVAYLDGKRFPAVVNIGTNPTFDDKVLSIEAHVLGFSGDIYNQKIRLAFFERLRGEIKFKGPEELIKQIKKDVADTREILAREVGEALFIGVPNPEASSGEVSS
jgi:riboflavin kinase / FMN adenylyltransferase